MALREIMERAGIVPGVDIRDEDVLLEASVEMTGAITIYSKLLEPFFLAQTAALAEAKRMVVKKDGEGRTIGRFYNYPLLERLQGLDNDHYDRRICDPLFSYVEEPTSRAFNIAPLLLVGTSSKEGATTLFGPMSLAQVKAYRQVLQETAEVMLNNHLNTSTAVLQMLVRKREIN